MSSTSSSKDGEKKEAAKDEDEEDDEEEDGDLSKYKLDVRAATVAGNSSKQVEVASCCMYLKKKKPSPCRMTTKRTMKTEICQSTTWMPATRTTNRRRKRAAAPVPRAPAPPRAPPAPVLGRGPGKRVQVQGNSRQNVSISSILHIGALINASHMSCFVALFLSFCHPSHTPLYVPLGALCALSSLNVTSLERKHLRWQVH